jgi:hypothetical protein
MKLLEGEGSAIETAALDLFNYAVDREDVKILMARLPTEGEAKRNTVEYELQILKIIGVGWSIAYHVERPSLRNQLAEHYWTAVQGLSQSLSSAAGLMVGQQIDYFQILKDRLNLYVEAMGRKPNASEPAVVIGPEFARICGNADDVYTVVTGSRMFSAVIAGVRQYLDQSGLIL